MDLFKHNIHTRIMSQSKSPTHTTVKKDKPLNNNTSSDDIFSFKRVFSPLEVEPNCINSSRFYILLQYFHIF